MKGSPVLGGAAPVQPVTGIVIAIPYDDYTGQYNYGGNGQIINPVRRENKFTVTLEEAEKIRSGLDDAIASSRKIKDFFDL